MDEKAILEYLLGLLEANQVAIRTEPMGGRGGGLCKLKNRTIFFVDSEASTADIAVLAARAVNEIVDLEAIYIVPQIRDFLEKHAADVDFGPAK
ncbi:MAG TPA: hypothetical protein P5279_10165 [Anaerohalosphaeraceae bacterium]|jgi:hypothetical protein|nr:hypothetical protein [Anaerohalosphaeraceae bacterium]HRT50848.1 hypothetical protein [Anaerohalosphaeraceae bacterium]HRT86714.1 hypothetical protein [Anaerohalosphaeraceae bacterium]